MGFHPIAVEWTSDEARAGRDEVDRAAAADPAGSRSAFGSVLEAPASPERLATINESLHRAYAAFTRGDFELNTLSIHPANYVYAAGGELPGLLDVPTRLDGVEGYILGLLEFQDAWDEIRLVSEAVADAGPGQIFNWARFRLRGSGSGVALEQPIAVRLTFEGEWCVLQEYWWDRDEGTRAAGVDPAALSFRS